MSLHDEVVTLAQGPTSGSPQRSVKYIPTVGPLHGATALYFLGPKMQLRVFVETPTRRYALRGAFMVMLESLEDNVVFASNADLQVSGYGESAKEALEDFSRSFDLQYRELVEKDESALTAGGRDRRQALKDVVDSVTEAHAP